MSYYLDLAATLDPERRQALEATDADLRLAQLARDATPRLDKAVRVNREPERRVSGHAVDAAIQSLGEGVERVEVRPFFRMEDAAPADCMTPEQVRALWEV